MTNDQSKKLLDLYKLALQRRIEEQTIKDEIKKTSIEMDRAFVKGEDSSDTKEFYDELQNLLEIFNMPV